MLATRADDDGRPLLDADGQPRTRAITVLFQGGIDVQRSYGDGYGGWWQQVAIMFHAAQPFWQRARPVTRTFGNAPPLPWFPWFPVLASGALLGRVDVVNDGSTQAYPVWTITDPGSSVTLRNLSTDQTLTVDTSGAAGQTVIVDTRPTWLGGRRSVTRADGGSLYDRLTGSLWTLPRGTNSLDLSVAGSLPSTSIRLEFSPLDSTP